MENRYWKIIQWLGGRKCFLVTFYSCVMESVLLIASVILAFSGKLTPEWISIFKVYSGYSATLVIGYVIGNVQQKKIINGK